MKTILLSGLLFLVFSYTQAQRYSAKNGYVGFYSHTSIEDIKADNNQVASILDSGTGEIVFLINNKSFIFDKALMQEHFNENYMETEKYGKSTFKGTISNLTEIDFSKDGIYKVEVFGEMNMHGVSKNILAKGTIEVKGKVLTAKSSFFIIPEDYAIQIPGLVRDKIAKEIQVTVDVKYLSSAK